MFTATLYLGIILLVLSGLAFGWSLLVGKREGRSVAQTGIFTFIGFMSLTLGVLLFSMGYFANTFAQQADPVGDNPPVSDYQEETQGQ